METTISLSDDLRTRAEQQAQARGITLSQFVCESLEWVISRKLWDDPLFSDRAVFSNDAPADLAEKHDEYLYGDEA